MITGLSAVRSGIVMFVIPFVFAFYPELLLIKDAVLDPNTSGVAVAYLPGYDGAIDWGAMLWLIVRLIAALYLLASALAQFDRKALAPWDWGGRLILAVLIMFANPAIHVPALVTALILVSAHFAQSRRAAAPA